MKLLRFGDAGKEKPGLVDKDGRIRDLSGVVADITPAQLSDAAIAKLAALDPAGLPLASGTPRIGPPVAGIPKIVAVGLNYSDHAKEAGLAVPNEPVLFSKAITSLSGPNDDVRFPATSHKGDYEAELAFVIGKTARHVAERDALSHIAGYCICNDVSERGWQLDGTGQWVKGKSYDTWAPLGPWLVTRDEVPDPQKLDIRLTVNGKTRQSGSTKTMIFPVSQLVSYISGVMTLMPGDVVITGTPPGVALGMKPPGWLQNGDEIHITISGLGEQRQKVVRAK
ncbi:MAG: fumarylacetoacetate hydrolase family protein [Pseudomonadota bacterium]|nr:fumarylacetoacetate hydrolase family protein [Pseudomonadota bacterium]